MRTKKIFIADCESDEQARIVSDLVQYSISGRAMVYSVGIRVYADVNEKIISRNIIDSVFESAVDIYWRIKDCDRTDETEY